MGVFDDKKFEQLDWMSQITEGIESELNGLLARLPERIELDYDSITSFMDSGYGSPQLSIGSVVRKLIRIQSGKSVAWEDEQPIANCFEFQTSEGGCTLDMENKKITGTISLIKIKNTLDDDFLQSRMGARGLEHMRNIDWSGPGAIARANEIMEVIGDMDDCIKGRSGRKKYLAIRNEMARIFRSNEWRIRDTELADKIGKWIAAYVKDGNLAAFSNFCKVKVMTHQGGPIYSIEEQE